MQVQIFWESSPQKFLWPKICKILPDFERLQTSEVNISRMDEDILTRSSIWSTTILPVFDKKNLVNFGPENLEV